MAEWGLRIHPSKKLPPPFESSVMNGSIVSHALAHIEEGFSQFSTIKVCPSCMSQACSIGFSYCSIRSEYEAILITVIFTFFIVSAILCPKFITFTTFGKLFA